MAINRRDFIKTTAATAAGIGITQSLPGTGRILGSNDKITLALIGTRNMGFMDLLDILKQPNIVCKTLCDVDDNWLTDRSAKLVKMGHKQPELVKDYRKIMDDKDIDAVIIGTPDHWHCLPTVEACEAGKHVYVEKPLANSIGEINVMLDAARKYKSIVQVGQHQRSGAHWKSAVEFVQSGKLGTIRQVKFWGNFNYAAGDFRMPDSDPPEGVDYDFWLGPAPSRPFNGNRFHRFWRLWRDYGGGLTSDWGVHLIDIGLWAMNVKSSPRSVSSIGGNFAGSDRGSEMPDTLSVLYEMEGFNMVWEHNAGVQSGPYDQSYGVKFIGTNGTLVADRDKWQVFPEEGLGKNKATGNIPVNQQQSADKKDEKVLRMEAIEKQMADGKSHINHCENFVRAIRYGDKLNAEIEFGHRAALYSHLGNISHWADDRIKYDEHSRKITNSEKANELITPAYRAPWEFPSV
jgi:predicted dehydrogenase